MEIAAEKDAPSSTQSYITVQQAMSEQPDAWLCTGNFLNYHQ